MRMNVSNFGLWIARPWINIVRQAKDDWRNGDRLRCVGSVSQLIMITLFWACVAGIVVGLLVWAWERPPVLLIYLAIIAFVLAIWRSTE